MQEIEIAGTFDSADSASNVARALNTWFQWVMENEDGEALDVFEDFGLPAQEYAIDRETDTDWEEMPVASAASNHVVVVAYTSETQDYLQELLESMGAFEVEITTGE